MTAHTDLWKKRLQTPSYTVKEAARFARTSPQTISNWQKISGNKPGAISSREPGSALTYMQLIEVGVVAAMRKAGVPLKAIRSARDYLSTNFDSRFPFVEYRFKTSGKDLIVASEDLRKADKNKLVVVSESGQYAWREILQQLLQEFEYTAEENGSVVRWNVAGRDQPIIIDPRIAYGSPSVSGIQTAVIANRWKSGDTVEDIAEDFELQKSVIMSALHFEKADIQNRQWLN